MNFSSEKHNFALLGKRIFKFETEFIDFEQSCNVCKSCPIQSQAN